MRTVFNKYNFKPVGTIFTLSMAFIMSLLSPFAMLIGSLLSDVIHNPMLGNNGLIIPLLNTIIYKIIFRGIGEILNYYKINYYPITDLLIISIITLYIYIRKIYRNLLGKLLVNFGTTPYREQLAEPILTYYL